MIRKLKSGKYRLYSGNKDRRTGKRKNLGTFNSGCGEETRTRGSVFQTALGRFRNVVATGLCLVVSSRIFLKPDVLFCRLD